MAMPLPAASQNSHRNGGRLFALVSENAVVIWEALGAGVLAGLEHPKPAVLDVDG
jgi:hypothetical protein